MSWAEHVIPGLVADITLIPNHGRQFCLKLFDRVAMHHFFKEEVVHAEQAEEGIACDLEELPCALFKYLTVVTPFRIFCFQFPFW